MRSVPTYTSGMTTNRVLRVPASGEQIVSHFRTFDHNTMWAENWWQGPGAPARDPDVPGTASTIQGVLCCVDRDETIAWLLMICDETAGAPVSYICMTFSRLPAWDWSWVCAKDNLAACRGFVDWLEANDAVRAARRAAGSTNRGT